MSKTAFAAEPLPATPRARARAQSAFPRTASVEERTAVLEARWEETVPTLATKADVRGAENRLILWGIGAALAATAWFSSMISGNTARIDQVNARIDEVNTRIDTRMDRLEARFEKIDERFEKVDARFEKIDARFEKIDARFEKIDERFDSLDARFEALLEELRRSR